MRGCHQTAGMPLYPPMCTHKGWDTGQGLRLQAGLTNSNKTGSGSQNPKAQKIAVGRKNTQCLQSALPPPPSPHSQAFTASLVPGRSPNLCSVRNLLRTPAQSTGFSWPPWLIPPSFPATHHLWGAARCLLGCGVSGPKQTGVSWPDLEESALCGKKRGRCRK